MAERSLQLNSGYKMPVIGLGTWQSPQGQVEVAIESAIEYGYRHIDCAHVYQNETEIGNAIAKIIKENKIKREDIFITSKLWNSFHKPEDVKPALMKSLNMLQTSYLDLYLMHWPMGYMNTGDWFPSDKDGKLMFSNVDYVETWKIMEALQKEGLVRSIGVSNFNEFQLNRILKEGSIPPAVNQIELHPYLIQKDLVNFCSGKGVVVTAYSPFASPDRPWAEKGEPLLLEEPKLIAIADRLQKTVAQVILRYLIQRNVIVIPKSATPHRIQSNFDVFGFELNDEDVKTIESFNRNFRAVALTNHMQAKYYPFRENYSE
ncbi:aldo-keto reductase 1B-like [Clavelina lepadiformis]|uniref:aldo-keto reductase 1B-like n=1 Tax=Clavelina lepadiformis TaxID=159417 RepID=UPI0040437867